MYEMVIGVTPFSDGNMDAKNMLIGNLELYWPEDFKGSYLLKDLVGMLLEKDPERRMAWFKDTSILDHGWFKQELAAPPVEWGRGESADVGPLDEKWQQVDFFEELFDTRGVSFEV
jgi:hypothetical protein